MKTLLITGFDPFNGGNVNPSWEAVSRLPETIGEYRISRLLLPTVYRKASSLVLQEAAELCPDVIISVGLAANRTCVTPERIGVNILDASIADNTGGLHGGEPVDPEGPAAYFSTLPVQKMVDSIRAAGIPAAVSNTAGTFVCNNVLYALLHHYADTNVRCGFIHVPAISEDFPLERIVQALQAAIEAL